MAYSPQGMSPCGEFFFSRVYKCTLLNKTIHCVHYFITTFVPRKQIIFIINL